MKVDGMGVIHSLFRKRIDRFEVGDKVFAPVANVQPQQLLDNTFALYEFIKNLTGSQGLQALAEAQMAKTISHLFTSGVIYLGGAEEGDSPSPGCYSVDGKTVHFGSNTAIIEGREAVIPKMSIDLLPDPVANAVARLESGNLILFNEIVELGFWPPEGDFHLIELEDVNTPADRIVVYHDDDKRVYVSKFIEGSTHTGIDENGVLHLLGQVFEGRQDVSSSIDYLVFMEGWLQQIDPKTGQGLKGPVFTIEDKVVYPNGNRNAEDGVAFKDVYPHISSYHLYSADPGDITRTQWQFRLRVVAGADRMDSIFVKAQGPLDHPGSLGFSDLGGGVYASNNGVYAIPWFVFNRTFGDPEVGVRDLRQVVRSVDFGYAVQKSGDEMEGTLRMGKNEITFGDRFKMVYNEAEDSLDVVVI